MQIIDAQIHIWGQGLPNNRAHIQVTSFSAAEAIAMMDAAGVDAAVLHPPGWDPNATELAIDAVKAYPGRFAIMGALSLDRPLDNGAFRTWRDQPGMLGLRYLMLGAAWRERIETGDLDWLWGGAEAAGVPIALLATDCLAQLSGVAQRFPELELTIDHLGGRGGNTELKDHAAMVHMPELTALARHDNVSVKVTGAPGYSAEDYPYPIMQGYVRQIFDAFGPDRTFWGTDITKMPCTWRQCITMFTEELDWLAGEELERVMGQAVCRRWGWNRDRQG